MKSTLEPATQRKKKHRSNKASEAPADNYVIPLPYSGDIKVGTGDTVQWSWTQPFSVTVSNGVTDPCCAQATTSNGQNQYVTTPALTVVGQLGAQGQCVYALIQDADDDDDDDQGDDDGNVSDPPPPPNQIIVDHS